MIEAPPQSAKGSPEVLLGRGRLLIPVWGVTSLLDRNENQVTELMESGEILYAWNLALQPERSAAMLYALLPCVEDFAAGRQCPLEWLDVVKLLLPSAGQIILATDIVRILNVSNSHVFALIRRNEFGAVSKWRPGPGGSARVKTQSFVDFFRRRRWPFSEKET